MPCKPFRSADGKIVGIVCSREPRNRPCRFCGNPSSKLCDYPVSNGKTCDAPLCPACAVHIEPDTDYCPNHKTG